jgi:hypothetical protein
MLDLTFVGPEHRAALVEYLEARRAEQPAELPKLDITRARQVELTSAMPFHVDDELAPDDVGGRATAAIAEGVQVLLPA